jgi:mannose-6-phosphate isomerase-like protein (cupin superfamily)
VPSAEFPTARLSGPPDAIAPDGSEVRILCATSRGGMASFTLPPGAVAKAVAHHTVEEIWYVVSGRGRLWRKRGAAETVTDLVPGVSAAIAPGTHFQFRCDGAEALSILAATMPPWPGEGEACFVDGKWETGP